MKKIKKQLLIVLSVLCCVVLAIGLTACGKTEAPKDGKSALDLWLESNSGKTESDFWAWVKGEPGKDGQNGKDGADGKDGQDGENGKSAYEVWKGLEGNANKTEAEFIEAIKGAAGVAGEKGDKGDKGDDGVGIKTIAVAGNEFVITLTNNEVVRVSIPAVGNTCEHDYDSWVLQEGEGIHKVTLKVCKECGTSVIEREGHVWEDSAKIAPTCDKEGYEGGKVCTICGETKDGVAIPKLDHKNEDGTSAIVNKLVILTDKDGNELNFCEYGGQSIDVCTLCDKVVEVKAVDAPGHQGNDWKIKTVPAKGVKGLAQATCAVCGKVIEKELPALDSEKAEGFYTVTNLKENKLCSEEGEFEYAFTLNDVELKFTVKTPAGNHIFNGEEVKDYSKVFEITEDNKDKLKVFGNVEASCDSEGVDGYFVCENPNCKEVIKVKVRLAHVASEEVISKSGPTCTEKGNIVYKCKNCENGEVEVEVPALGHDFKYEITKDVVAEGATQTYTIKMTCKRDGCGYTETKKPEGEVKVTRVEPTCKAAGYVIYTYVEGDQECTAKEDLAKLNHKTAAGEMTLDKYPLTGKYAGIVKLFGNGTLTCADEVSTVANGYFTCDLCKEVISVVVYAPHEAPEGTEWIEATCTEGRYRTFTCVRCGKETTEYDEENEALGHDYKYEVTGEEGNYTVTGTCTRCGDVKVEKATKVEHVANKAPTCTEEGNEYLVVTTEDGKTTRKLVVLPKTAHKASVEANKDGTYTFDGNVIKLFGNNTAPSCSAEIANENGYFVCTMCGEVISVKVRSAHVEGDDLEIKAATCTEDGYKKFTCKVCGELQEEVYKATGHNYEYSATANWADKTVTVVKKCTKCDAEAEKILLEKKLDDEFFTETEDSVEATCEKAGLRKYTFEYEGKTLTVEVEEPSTSHDLNEKPVYEWVVNGNTWQGKICKDCGKVIAILVGKAA